MHLSENDYRKIYRIQDKVLELISDYLDNFYLTGGTALARFYLDHRFSDDLDFFTHKNPSFQQITKNLFDFIKSKFTIDNSATFTSNDFVRIGIIEDAFLKVEFVNDIAFHWGKILKVKNSIPVDNVTNILANKLTALTSRDEPKDVFDIVTISSNFSFNWKEIYDIAFEKQMMSEADVAMRLATFPVDWLKDKNWFKETPNFDEIKEKLKTIADDFLFAKDNSLGKSKTPINEAVPIIKP
jgi:predicted nucleotidyltransferase component of viral defense system